MAQVRNFPFVAQLRADASSHVIRYRKGRVRQSGRGLVFWFRPETASIAELPMDDREMALFVKGRSQDFQTVAVQGTLTWRVADPELLAARVDFTIGLNSGSWTAEPIQRIETRLAGLVNQAVLQYLAQARVQTPTFEALQQKADQATFERRALAVEKERAIAENELANRTELARREQQLIAEEAANARARAAGVAEAQQVETAAEAERIRAVESAKAEAELAHMAVYRDLPPAVLLGLAARDLAGKLDTIEHLNVTPDLLATLLGEFRRVAPALPAK
ncbi:band 7 protein [Sphingomonas pituitosa]|uniref:band 7 protein n=1 Tax=Sphingomonas pituitosa TaxID=99597 RepID=UPI000836CCE9|nr:band 7 protein [Sphingomonas pituitosa]